MNLYIDLAFKVNSLVSHLAQGRLRSIGEYRDDFLELLREPLKYVSKNIYIFVNFFLENSKQSVLTLPTFTYNMLNKA